VASPYLDRRLTSERYLRQSHVIIIKLRSMSKIIVYASRYGSTKRYADKLSELTGVEAVDYSKVKDISAYDKVIYMGSILAGTVTGLKKTVSKMKVGQELVIVSVGMIDPKDPENVSGIRSIIRQQIPAELNDESRIFHLQGCIDYPNLKLSHRMLMSMMRSMASKKPESELDAVSRTVLATYGQRIDNVDLSALDVIVPFV